MHTVWIYGVYTICICIVSHLFIYSFIHLFIYSFIHDVSIDCYSPHHCVGFLFFAWHPPLLPHPAAPLPTLTTYHISLITPQLITAPLLTPHSSQHYLSHHLPQPHHHTTFITALLITPLVTAISSRLAVWRSCCVFRVAGAVHRAFLRSCCARGRRLASNTQGLLEALLRAWLPAGPRLAFVGPAGGAAARMAAAGCHVAGAVHRASWRSWCGRGRWWPAAGCRVAGAVHRASRRSCCHTTLSHRFVTHTHTPSFTHHLSHHAVTHTIFHTPSLTHHLLHTIFDTPSLTHHFVTHHLSHTIFDTPSFTHHLSHTIFHTQLCHPPSLTHHLCHTPSFTTPSFTHIIFHTPLCHTPSFTHRHRPSFTHHFVTHHLSHKFFIHHLSHTTLSHTIFHTPSLTHHFVTHHLSHTVTDHLPHKTLSHTIFDTLAFKHNLVTHHLAPHHLCHTPSFTTPSFTHTTLSHTIFPPPPPLSFLPSPSRLQHVLLIIRRS